MPRSETMATAEAVMALKAMAALRIGAAIETVRSRSSTIFNAERPSERHGDRAVRRFAIDKIDTLHHDAQAVGLFPELVRHTSRKPARLARAPFGNDERGVRLVALDFNRTHVVHGAR